MQPDRRLLALWHQALPPQLEAGLQRLFPPLSCQPAACADRRVRRAQMSRSTIFMPCNYSGPYDPAIAAKFGIVDFDVRQPLPLPT